MKQLLNQHLVLDASVLVKLISTETNSQKTISIWQLFIENKSELYLPQICYFEIANVMLVSKKIATKDIFLFVDELKKYDKNQTTTELGLLNSSVAIAQKQKITPYDAIYIALAEKIDGILLTADFQHHKKQFSKRICYLEDLK